METLSFIPEKASRMSRMEVLLPLLLSAFFFMYYLPNNQTNFGLVDPGILQLLLLSACCFIMATVLIWWLHRWIWQRFDLPRIQQLFKQFNYLTLWQQYVFCLACFALLSLLALGCLIAIL